MVKFGSRYISTVWVRVGTGTDTNNIAEDLKIHENRENPLIF